MSFEQACADTERSALDAAKSAAAAVAAAKRLAKAAADGDIAKLRRATETLRTVEQALKADIRNAMLAWPFTPDQEERYLSERYQAELCAIAADRGLDLREQDGHLLSYPSFVRILPEARVALIDRARVALLRPTRLVEMLKSNQQRKPTSKPEQFIEALYDAYELVTGGRESSTTLVKIYRAMTLRPGSAKEYTKSDFARDIYFLDHSDVKMTKKGARILLPASTATKGGSTNRFTFVGRDGKVATYYGISFTGAQV
ncbi:MAG TPA: hypothetical protein VNI78_00280 [Vicinamibacterales bacterium]|nr:hypothetical protein [Vicinamibacterales bacterium]